MKKVFLVLLCLVPIISFSQYKDTVYIRFDQKYDEMEKVDFTEKVQAGSPDEELEKSITYFIRQMERIPMVLLNFVLAILIKGKKLIKLLEVNRLKL